MENQNTSEVEVIDAALLFLPILSTSAPLSKIPREISVECSKHIFKYIENYVNIECKKRIQILDKILTPNEIFGSEDLLFNDLIKNGVNIDDDLIKYYKNDLLYNLSKDSYQLNLGYIVILLTFNESPTINDECNKLCVTLKTKEGYSNSSNDMALSIKDGTNGISDIVMMDLGVMSDVIRTSVFEYNKKSIQSEVEKILRNKNNHKKHLSTTLIIEDNLLFKKNVIGVVLTNNITGEHIQVYWNIYDQIDVEISKFIDFYVEYEMETKKLFIKDLLISNRKILDSFLLKNSISLTRINEHSNDSANKLH
jgi:hypothetical protein